MSWQHEAQEGVIVVNTNAPKYMKGAEDLTLRDRLLLAMLRRRGRLLMNQSGPECNWTVKFAEPTVEAYAAGALLSFAPNDLYRTLGLDWRGYKVTDKMTDKEYLMNRGKTAIVKRYDKTLGNLTDALRNHFCGELFIDGYAPNNQNRLHGLESFFGTGTTAAGDICAQPSDSYAGHSTVLATEGGVWTSDLTTSPNANLSNDWPYGSGDASYDWLAPKVANYVSSGWGTGSQTWRDNCDLAMRQLKIWVTRTAGREGRPDIALLADDMLYEFKNKMDAKLRDPLPHPEARDLGFPDTLNYEGMAVQGDFDCPAGTGYVMNVDKMVIASLQNQLFASKGPEYSIEADAYLFSAGIWANVRYQPKFFGKLAAVQS